jgi:hypothetical protein
VRSSYELALSGSRRLSSKLSPIRGIQAVREGRGHVAVGRAFLDRVPCLLPPAPEPEKCDATRLELMNLNLIDFDVPLAWQLSPKAVELVFLHSGNVSSSEVAQDNVRQAPISVYETLLRNNRSFQRIVKILD